MSDYYPNLLKELSPYLKELRSESKEAVLAFGQLKNAALKDGELDKKTKELIALAIGVAQKCDPCIAHHTKALIDLGATKQEIIEMLNVAVFMGGGALLMYAAKALEAYDQLSS
ncbi:MAG: carboxymuconolactone decarboxylase family protein [Chlamydiota bacterium]